MTVGGAFVYVCKRGRVKDYITRFPRWSCSALGKKSDKHSPQKINTKYLRYNIVMLYLRYLVFIFCSVNKLCLKFKHCFTY